MFNSFYAPPATYSQATPVASNNPFQQAPGSTNPFRQTVYLPQSTSQDLYASSSHHGVSTQPQPYPPSYPNRSASPPIGPEQITGSASASFGGYILGSYRSGPPHLPTAATMAPQGTLGSHFDPVVGLTSQFGHMRVGVCERDTTSSGYPQSLPASPNPLLLTGIFEEVGSSLASAGYGSPYRHTSCSSSTHSPPTPAQSPSPWSVAAPSAPSLGSPAPIPTRVGSPGLMPLRRGSPARHVRSIREAPIRYQPPMRESGRPGTLWMCPRDTVIRFRTTWHVLRVAGMKLTCCPPCYVASATGGSLGFTPEELETTRCMFHCKRAQALLLAGDSAGIAIYFQTRSNINDCSGVAGCGATEDITWYRPIGGPKDSLCCEACFEDHAKANAWATRFERVTPPANITWACDFAIDSVRDWYIKLAPDHWDDWSRLVDRRSGVRPCTSSDVKAGSRKWYTITPAITGLVVCEACYLDKVTTSRFATHFVPYVVGNPNDVYMCDFSSLYFVFPFMIADETNAWGKFQTAASRVMDCAMAQMNGARQQFWGLGPGPRGLDSDWDVCEKCYASLFEPYGFDRFLHPRPPPKVSRFMGPTARQCDMCPGAPHKAEMLARLQEAAYAGVFSHFSDWARRAAVIQYQNRPEGACYATRGGGRPREVTRLYQ